MSRPPMIRIHAEDLIVDNFAGGGGASEGIRLALGRDPDIAVNHDPEALAMHAANHPGSRHLCGDVWDVKPAEVCAGRRVALAWFSPDCKHFSKAKGGKPVEKKIRSLAWVAVRWAREVRPRVIVLENVEEFQTWGPLLEDGRPCPARRGLTFRRWLGALRAAGYEVELRELRACDYGAPTIRKRLFVIARCDGAPIEWPEPTHGPGRLPYRTAAECIQWELPCPSIFERKKPLAEKTLARIARGIQRFVLESAEPFVVRVAGGRVNDAAPHATTSPLRTVTGAHRGELALVAPTLVQTGYGERVGQAPRALDLGAPLGTVVAGGAKHALVQAFLAKHYGGHEGSGARVDAPFATITTRDHHALVLAFLTRFYATGQRTQLPLGTVTSAGWKFGVVTVHGAEYRIADIGMRMLAPRELFRAQGFRSDYLIEAAFDGKPLSKESQIRMCGNSVCPPLAAAIVSANLGREEVVAA